MTMRHNDLLVRFPFSGEVVSALSGIVNRKSPGAEVLLNR